MKTKLIAALWLLFSFTAMAQTTATITGTIKDLTGSVVTSGQVTFLLQPGIDTTISGTARFTPSTVTCGINGSGLVKNLALSAACTITTNASLTPSGTSYKVCFWPSNVMTSCVITYILGDVDITTVIPTPSMSPTTFTDRVNIGTGIFSDGHGFKHKRVSSCATSAGAFASCQTTVTWGTAFADANYTLSCIISGSAGHPFVATYGTKLAASVTIVVATYGSDISNGTIDCIAVHD